MELHWENLTAPNFAKAVEATQGTCIVPLGVIEMHGHHLPLGTDMFTARAIAAAAVQIEPAVIFPPYYLTEIHEAKHQPGTIAIDFRLMFDLLENCCREIVARLLQHQFRDLSCAALHGVLALFGRGRAGVAAVLVPSLSPDLPLVVHCARCCGAHSCALRTDAEISWAVRTASSRRSVPGIAIRRCRLTAGVLTMIRESLRERLISVAEEKHADGRTIDLLLDQARECIDMFTAQDVEGSETGRSRLGGLPDLPSGTAWPLGDDDSGRPISYAHFLVQLNLAEMPAVDELRLPHEGYLWLFMRAWRNERVSLATVSQANGGTTLYRMAAPADNEWAYFPPLGPEQGEPMTTGAVPLRFEVGFSLPFGQPSFDSEFVQNARLVNRLYDVFQPPRARGRIGGYAYNTSGRGDHRLAIALLQNEAARPDPDWAELHRDELDDWQPFISIRANSLIDLSWGSDTSSLWTCIRRSDLAAGRLGTIAGLTAD